MLVNDQAVAQVEGLEVSDGWIGLGAGTFGEPTAIAFDNFNVWSLDSADAFKQPGDRSAGNDVADRSDVPLPSPYGDLIVTNVEKTNTWPEGCRAEDLICYAAIEGYEILEVTLTYADGSLPKEEFFDIVEGVTLSVDQEEPIARDLTGWDSSSGGTLLFAVPIGNGAYSLNWPQAEALELQP